MKRIIFNAGLILVTVVFLTGCEKKADKTDESETESQYITETSTEENNRSGYRELLEMDEVTIEDSLVTVVLEEDGALPYRWEIIEQEGLILKDDYCVDEDISEDDTSVGSAPAFRVFVFELSDVDRCNLSLYNMRVGSDDKSEAFGNRSYEFINGDNGWTVK